MAIVITFLGGVVVGGLTVAAIVFHLASRLVKDAQALMKSQRVEK